MQRRILTVSILVAALAVATVWARAGEMPDGSAAFVAASRGPVQPIDARVMAERIDRLMAARWVANGLTPADQASDAGFLRRVYVDVSGRIPTAAGARAVLDGNDPEKRAKP